MDAKLTLEPHGALAHPPAIDSQGGAKAIQVPAGITGEGGLACGR